MLWVGRVRNKRLKTDNDMHELRSLMVNLFRLNWNAIMVKERLESEDKLKRP
jgi:hypothetical protein